MHIDSRKAGVLTRDEYELLAILFKRMYVLQYAARRKAGEGKWEGCRRKSGGWREEGGLRALRALRAVGKQEKRGGGRRRALRAAAMVRLNWEACLCGT